MIPNWAPKVQPGQHRLDAVQGVSPPFGTLDQILGNHWEAATPFLQGSDIISLAPGIPCVSSINQAQAPFPFPVSVGPPGGDDPARGIWVQAGRGLWPGAGIWMG